MNLSVIHLHLFWQSISSNVLPIISMDCLLAYWVWQVLYVLWLQVLYQVSDCRYFLPLHGLPFYSLNSVFQRTKYLNFNKSQFINIFSFMDHTLDISSRNHGLAQCHKDFPLCFLLQVSVLGLTFRTMIIFNYLYIVVRYGPKFIFCLWWSKCTNTFFYQIFFFHQIAFAPCWKWADGICADVFLDLLFYWVDLLVCLYAAPHHLNYTGFKIVSESDSKSSNFVPFWSCFSYLSPLNSHFQISFWISPKTLLAF